MKFYCPNCNTPYEIAGASTGRKALCQNCNTKFYITDRVPTAVVNTANANHAAMAGKETGVKIVTEGGDENMSNNPEVAEGGKGGGKVVKLLLAAIITLVVVVAGIFIYIKMTMKA